MATGYVIHFYAGYFAVSLSLVHRTHWATIGTIVAAVANVGLNLLLIPQYGLVGAATSTVVAFSLNTLVCGYQAQKYIRLQLDGLFILKSLLASIAMFPVLSVLPSESIAHLILNVIAGLCVYACAMLALRVFSDDEKRQLARWFQPRRAA